MLGCLFLAGTGPVRATTLTYLGSRTLPTGTLVGGVEVGGLSGITYDPYADRFQAVTDAGGRVWEIDLAYDGASFSSASVLSEMTLKTSGGAALPAADTEGIGAALDGAFFVSHEGLAGGSDPASSVPPWIRRFDPVSGNQAAEVALPVKFLPRDAGGAQVPPDAPTQTSGVRSNLSLESLGLTPDRRALFTANEAALKQDYAGIYDATFNQAQNSLSRIARFIGIPGSPSFAEEKVYQADLGTMFSFIRRFNTVADVLPIDDSGRLLVLERGLTDNNLNLGSYRIRIYEADFSQPGATDVAGLDSLIGAAYTPLAKTLRWESSAGMDNVEAMCFGRDVGGFRTLVLASDNNFSAAQTTQFHVLLTDIPAVPRRTLSVFITGSGAVQAEPTRPWYPQGSEVALNAVPGLHHTFGGWSGDASGVADPLALSMSADRSIGAAFLTPYASWAAGYFTPEEPELASPGSDPDGDGLSNLLEYALNLNPRQASSTGRPEVAALAGQLTLTYRKDPAKPDLAWQAEWSPTLAGWNPVADSLLMEDGPVEIRRASVPMTPPAGFLRLKVIKLF